MAPDQQEKLRTAERERAVAEARAVEERRRRLQVGLAAAVLALTTVGGLSTTYYLQQRQARGAAVARILGEATTLRDQARAHPDDLARWDAALAATRRVENALGSGGGDSRGQLATLRAEVQAALDASERDRRLLDRLADIRNAKADDPDGTATDLAYADAFQKAGLNLAALPPAEAGAKIKGRPPATALALAVALDDWAAVRRRRRSDRAGAKRLSDAAGAADPDSWRRDLRAALDQTDPRARLTALQAAARSARFDERGAVSLDLLGTALDGSGDPAGAERVLRAAQRRHPGDLWINYDLAQVCEKRNQRDEALRFYSVARSIRPETAHEMAHVLDQRGESDEAIAVFQDLARLRPQNGRHLACLGSLLQKLGRPEEAAPFLDASVAAGRAAIRLKPDDAQAHFSLAVALQAQGQVCVDQGRHAAAARLWADALAADPKLGDDRQTQHRYHAACSAALAGCGKSKDDPPPDETARAALRQQALDWLKAERAAWAQLLESGTPQTRATIVQTLKQWQQDAALAGVREGEALAQLPGGEQKAWRELWSDVETLLKKAAGDRP